MLEVSYLIASTYLSCKVYTVVPALQQSKTLVDDQLGAAEQSRSMINWTRIEGAARRYVQDLSKYCHHRAFLPSFSGALLYFTVLNFAGQMVTFLLASGYNSVHVGAARTCSVILEIAATWTAPLFMAKIGPIRAGIWFINWQMFCLAGAAGIFWGVQNPIIAASGLVAGTILSRIGLRSFDLCTQIIVQEVCS